jgi:hypothetical protein
MDRCHRDIYPLLYINSVQEEKGGHAAMTTGAWIMLVFGCVVLYGGLAWSLVHIKPGTQKTGKQQKGTKKR